MGGEIIFNPDTSKYLVFVDLQDESRYPCGAYNIREEAIQAYIESEKVLNWRKEKDIKVPSITYLKSKDDKITDLERRISILERKLKCKKKC